MDWLDSNRDVKWYGINEQKLAIISWSFFIGHICKKINELVHEHHIYKDIDFSIREKYVEIFHHTYNFFHLS